MRQIMITIKEKDAINNLYCNNVTTNTKTIDFLAKLGV
jgi:hypothetical protein